MTYFLLALLNAQLAAIVGWAVLERRSARRYRENALVLQDAQLDADLATWARIAGRHPVVTDQRGEDQEARNGKQGEFGAHPPMVHSGADV